MARRRTPTKRRRTQTKISLTGLAESYIIGSAATKMLTGNNLMEFVTGRRAGAFKPGADGGQNISLPELLGVRTIHGKTVFTGDIFGSGHFGGAPGRFNYTTAVKHNFNAHGMSSIGTMILTPIAFRMGKKLARKPITQINKMLKGSGLRV